MTSAVQKLPKHTFKLTITLPWNEVMVTYDKVVNHVVSETELPGFRKGKAPRKMVEEKIDKSKIYEEVIKQIVPKAYADSLKQHDITPIVSPRVTIIQAQENKDWQFEALTCQQPTVKLKNYKTEITKLKGGKKIWVPGSPTAKHGEEEKKGVELSEILRVLLTESEIEIPDLLIEDQVNRKLSDLIDQVKQLGMTVEQYLLSKGLTSDKLHSQYRKETEETLKLEFILEKVADNEKIVVTDDEIEQTINKTTDPKQKEALQNQRYYISMLLRRQKTLDTLSKPIV